MDLCRGGRFDMRHQRRHNHFPQAGPLMVRIESDIDDVEEQGSVPDDAAHANCLAGMADDDGEHGVGQASFGSADTPGR